MKLSQDLLDRANIILEQSDYVLANRKDLPIICTELNVALRQVLEAVKPEQQECSAVVHASEIRDYLLNQTAPEWIDYDDNSENVMLCDGDGNLAIAEGWYISVPKSLFTYSALTDGSPDATEEEVTYDDDCFDMSDEDMLEEVIKNINLTTLKHD